MGKVVAIAAVGVAGLVTAVALLTGSSPSPTTGTLAVTTSSSTTLVATTTLATTTTIAKTTTEPGPPQPEPRYVVAADESAPEAKQLAVDIAQALTNYEETDDPTARYAAIAGIDGVEALAEAAAPLTHVGMWSRGSIVYPQLGGLTNERVSVMTVTRQTVGTGSAAESTVVRTLDIRLVMGENGWEFDQLASAGGVFDNVEDLRLAGAVASDPRIEMPDSARLDILDGKISPYLLQVMLQIADITPYGITVMATGHPYNVFDTTRVSHHTGGRAIDINRVGDRHVIDDQAPGSATSDLVDWLWKNPLVVQVGSPFDVDGGGSSRSFENTVHLDHIHVAVIGPNDPTWVPAIGDRVWEDLDADGIQDAGEPGIAGVTVTLFDANGTELASAVTNGAGAYQFRDLYYGEYHVEIDVPSGYLVSPRNQGSDDSIDSDIDSSGVMATTLLDPRENDPRWDAGLYRVGAIGDLVWQDTDGDGIRDTGEPGKGGVTVRLFDASDTQVATKVTGSDGSYLFSNLTPGTYYVKVDIPAGWVATQRDQGGDDALDSDINRSGVTAATAIESNETDRRWDAGLTRPASIGDFVWVDDDGDGIQDPTELGLPDVTVRLFNASGREIASVVTDADGAWEFTGLTPGTYHVEIDIPDGYAVTLQDQAAGLPNTDDEEVDSDIDEDGVTDDFTLAPNEANVDLDAGLILLP